MVAARGGWRRGRAPIGVGACKGRGGVSFENPSDWGKGEFLVMRTTFEVDSLDCDSYRLSILAKQGFNVYLNGHKIHTYIWWKDAPFYRSIPLGPKHVAHPYLDVLRRECSLDVIHCAILVRHLSS